MKIQQNFTVQYNYDIHFTQHLFREDNPLFRTVIAAQRQTRVAFVIDSGVVDHHPDLIAQLTNYIYNADLLELAAIPLVVPGGEKVKNDLQYYDQTLALINDAKIDRHAYLVAIGGGALLDMVGFAAAVGHRGIRHIRIPTTVLSQNDSGVGVKNGVNFFGKKNFIGAFSPPQSVINDTIFLTTLDPRDWRAGVAEAIKVALIKDAPFFDWLEAHATAINERDLNTMTDLVYECAKWHCDHISGGNDPFERGSARPLDFGHWAAHKLEQLTRFEIRHGEAVAIGIALDVVYATKVGLLNQTDCDRILAVIASYGFDLFHEALLSEDGENVNSALLSGIEEFREHLGGELCITLINKIGHGLEVHEMNLNQIEAAVLTLQTNYHSHAH
ncbi:MAG: 3-dehydroquinate synthase [Cytophagales bacterium]|nr:3-dehydroquinate synthase [Cytophagales bacterium]